VRPDFSGINVIDAKPMITTFIFYLVYLLQALNLMEVERARGKWLGGEFFSRFNI